MIARRVRAHGRVQGVGFRDAMVDAATLAGAQGWVRNRRDGTVEAVFRGPDDRVRQMLDLCRRGPPVARVDRVDVHPAEAGEAGQPGFEQRPTA